MNWKQRNWSRHTVGQGHTYFHADTHFKINVGTRGFVTISRNCCLADRWAGVGRWRPLVPALT
jgi:hypothetical protein